MGVSISRSGWRVAWVPTFMAATTLPDGSFTGTAMERGPISSSWSTRA